MGGLSLKALYRRIKKWCNRFRRKRYTLLVLNRLFKRHYSPILNRMIP